MLHESLTSAPVAGSIAHAFRMGLGSGLTFRVLHMHQIERALDGTAEWDAAGSKPQSVVRTAGSVLAEEPVGSSAAAEVERKLAEATKLAVRAGSAQDNSETTRPAVGIVALEVVQMAFHHRQALSRRRLGHCAHRST